MPDQDTRPQAEEGLGPLQKKEEVIITSARRGDVSTGGSPSCCRWGAPCPRQPAGPGPRSREARQAYSRMRFASESHDAVPRPPSRSQIAGQRPCDSDEILLESMTRLVANGVFKRTKQTSDTGPLKDKCQPKSRKSKFMAVWCFQVA